MIVVMPIGGLGKRFVQAGYTFAKPLITIRNKPMLQWAVDSLGMPWAHHIFVCHEDDVARYPIREVCAQLTPKQELVVEPTRSGAAAAILYGLEHTTLPRPIEQEDLLIANADQWLQWDPTRFLECAWSQGQWDGAIPVFRSAHPKWSYARLDGRSRVVEVAEKRPISPWATCGVYYWKRVGAFVDCATQMIAAEERVNGEFYVAPVYNRLLQQGGQVMAYPDVTMYGLGTPEDLEEFKMAVCAGRIVE